MTWSEHLCAQGGADGPGPANCANCGGSGDCWSGLELELGCCVKVVWPGCCCLCPLATTARTALLHCHSTPGHYCTIGNLLSLLYNCLRLPCYAASCSDDVFESLHFSLSWLFLYLNMYLVDFSSYFYWTIFVYSTAVVQLLYTSTQAALA